MGNINPMRLPKLDFSEMGNLFGGMPICISDIDINQLAFSRFLGMLIPFQLKHSLFFK